MILGNVLVALNTLNQIMNFGTFTAQYDDLKVAVGGLYSLAEGGFAFSAQQTRNAINLSNSIICSKKNSVNEHEVFRILIVLQ